MAVSRLDARSHRPQRLRDPLHGPPAERVVPGQHEAALLARQDAGEEPHERARVPAVEWPGRLAQPAEPDTADADPFPLHGHVRAQSAHSRGRRERVLGGAEAVDLALAVGDRREEERTVRDRLVTRDRDVAAQRGGGFDLHQCPFR